MAIMNKHTLRSVETDVLRIAYVEYGPTDGDARMFVGLHEHRVVDAGHNLPQQKPQAFADAVLKVRDWFLLKGHR
jgi:hypothetical protein